MNPVFAGTMNPVFRAAGETAELGWMMGVLTVLFLICFLAWIWYATAPGNGEHLDAAARMPFDGGEA